jgi:thiol-disulfide isomerase/thioredoxin
MKLLILLFPLLANATVTDLTTPEQVKQELAKPGPRVLLYYTDWCGACQALKPTYSKLSDQMIDVRFYTMFVGKSEEDLRDTPCTDLNGIERTIPILKKTIKGCLSK